MRAQLRGKGQTAGTYVKTKRRCIKQLEIKLTIEKKELDKCMKAADKSWITVQACGQLLRD